MISCEATTFAFPMLASIYYPIVEQSAYGNVTKDWMLDRTVACNFAPVGADTKENLKAKISISEEMLLLGRVRKDIRMSERNQANSSTNIIVSNLSDKHGNDLYLETSGVRVGKPTLFEIATVEPYVGPFGSVEYYSVVLRRSENQAVTL